MMKKVWFMMAALLMLLCSCQSTAKELTWKNDEVLGIDFTSMLDESLYDIKYTLDKNEQELKKDDVLLGTYYLDEKVAGYDVFTTLQFAYFEDVNLENWEKEKPESKHQLAWYSKQWNWETDVYSEDDYGYVITVYENLCESYGEPYQLQEGPEGYRVGEDLGTGFTAMWCTSQYEEPNMILSYTIDSRGAKLVYKIEGEFAANSTGLIS